MQPCRAVKNFLSSRLIMNSRRLWNSHQRRKFLRAEAPRDIQKFGVSEMTFTGVFTRYFLPQMLCCFVKNTRKTGENAVEMEAFHDIARLECFTDLNLLTGKYVFNVIQNWETTALQFYLMVLIFCQQLWQKEIKVAS